MAENQSRASSVHGQSRAAQGELVLLLLAAVLIAGTRASSAQERAESPFDKMPSLWEAGVGEGFQKGTSELCLSAGAGFGMTVLGSRVHHDWALGALDYGWMFTGVVARDHWFRGNCELLGSLFGGMQFHPEAAYLVGLTPLLRYNFATGSRWVPFLTGGAGLTATDIRDSDLSTTFQFNLQVGAGTRFFFRDNLALSLQYRFIHISNAGIKEPNSGVNNSTVLLGLTWFFQPRHALKSRGGGYALGLK